MRHSGSRHTRRPVSVLASLCSAAWATLAIAACLAWFVPGTAHAQDAAANTASVTRFLETWRAAWARQDINAYLAVYAKDCVVDGRASADFETHKRGLFARGTPLEVGLGDLRIGSAELAGEALVLARFDQEYTSSLLSDFGRKELLLRPVGSSFLIVSETWFASSGVIQAPLGAQATAAPVPPAPTAPVRPAPTAPIRPATADEPLLGTGYVPPAETTPTAPRMPGGEALAMDPLLGRSFDVVEPDYGLPGDSGDRRVVEEIVANVNGEILTRTMLLQRIGWYEATLLEDRPADLDEQLTHLAQSALDATIDRWLILQEARARSADVEGFWRSWLTQFRRQMEADNLDDVDKLLREQGSSLAELHEQVLETEVPNVYLQQAIGEQMTFTEEEIETYFQANRAKYQRAKTVTLRQILIPVAADEDPAKAESVADAVVGALRDGKEWCETHEIYSAGGPRCGDLGSIAVDDLLPELRDAASGVPIGAISLPLLSSQGWHVLSILGREGAEPVELAQARDRVLGDLKAGQYEQRTQAYLDGLRAAALITVNPRYPTERDWTALASAPRAGE